MSSELELAPEPVVRPLSRPTPCAPSPSLTAASVVSAAVGDWPRRTFLAILPGVASGSVLRALSAEEADPLANSDGPRSPGSRKPASKSASVEPCNGLCFSRTTFLDVCSFC